MTCPVGCFPTTSSWPRSRRWWARCWRSAWPPGTAPRACTPRARSPALTWRPWWGATCSKRCARCPLRWPSTRCVRWRIPAAPPTEGCSSPSSPQRSTCVPCASRWPRSSIAWPSARASPSRSCARVASWPAATTACPRPTSGAFASRLAASPRSTTCAGASSPTARPACRCTRRSSTKARSVCSPAGWPPSRSRAGAATVGPSPFSWASTPPVASRSNFSAAIGIAVRRSVCRRRSGFRSRSRSRWSGPPWRAGEAARR